MNRFSGGDGRTVSILGGVHCDEIEGVLALRILVARLAAPGAAPLRATLRWIVSWRETGDPLRADHVIGTVVDEDMQPLDEVCASGDGVLMLLRRTGRLVAGDTLAIVASVGGSVDGTAGASVGGQVPV